MKKIKTILKSEKETAKKLLQEYLAELSAFDSDIKFDKNHVPIYKWFDYYWREKDRYPFFLIIENEIAGFCYVRKIEYYFDIAEFYVKPNYRINGNSIFFAKEIRKLFATGELHFATRHTNERAIKFWSKFAEEYQNSTFLDDLVWRNWIITK